MREVTGGAGQPTGTEENVSMLTRLVRRAAQSARTAASTGYLFICVCRRGPFSPESGHRPIPSGIGSCPITVVRATIGA